MSFFINCLKPPGMTSHDVVSYLRKKLNTKRIGHTGTLDPAVAGVLPMAVGKATRAIEYLNDDKKYRCEALLGLSTETQDLFGAVTQKLGCQGITEQQILANLEKFKGTINQVPPMYSAIKIKGKRLYELARVGKEVEVPARTVEIKELQVISIIKKDNFYLVLFDIWCEKGTYVRTICHDLGKLLGCGGAMSFLIRMEAGPFKIEDAVTLEEIASNRDFTKINIEDALLGMDSVMVDDLQQQRLSYGQAVKYNSQQLKQARGLQLNCDNIKVFTKKHLFMGIGQISMAHGEQLLKMKKTLI
ncbi:MAG: tRNA pseudouridine(55) synthase TruB [Bacillota bacterium]|nr:tRNA pseudouridine(55) synthase TruB [Bacillota bacterium]